MNEFKTIEDNEDEKSNSDITTVNTSINTQQTEKALINSASTPTRIHGTSGVYSVVTTDKTVQSLSSPQLREPSRLNPLQLSNINVNNSFAPPTTKQVARLKNESSDQGTQFSDYDDEEDGLEDLNDSQDEEYSSGDHESDDNDAKENDEESACTCDAYVYFRNWSYLFGFQQSLAKQTKRRVLERLVRIEKIEMDNKRSVGCIQQWDSNTYIKEHLKLNIDQRRCVNYLENNICGEDAFDYEKTYFSNMKNSATRNMVLTKLLAVKVIDRCNSNEALSDDIFKNKDYHLNKQSLIILANKLRK